MKNTFNFEFRRGIKSRSFLISLLISLAIVLADFANFYKYSKGGLYPNPVIEAWLGTDYKFAYNSMYYILLPILSALPYAASYYEDISSGYVRNILIKTSRKKYYISKYVSVFLIGAISVFIALFSSLILCMSFYPLMEPEKLLFLTSSGSGTSFMPELNNTHPTLFIMLYIILDSFFAGAIAVFSVCIGENVASSFSAVASPFAVYIVTSAVLARPQNNLSLMYILNPQQPFGNNGYIILLYGLVLMTTSILWTFFKGRRKEIY